MPLATTIARRSTPHPMGRAALATVLAGAVLQLAACSHEPPPPPPVRTTVPVSINVGPDANPDTLGRPSPIVTRVYQLASKDKFTIAAPIQLIQHDTQALGTDQLGRDEFVLQPGDKKQMVLPQNDKVHYVGIVAAYRAIDQANWREVVALPDTGPVTLNVTVGANGLVVKRDTADAGTPPGAAGTAAAADASKRTPTK
ncbi:type VI secretion system protein VasD [Nitrospirillum amazonense]|uniref:Type VI secretion system protein VasD n=1 Tax=Nitrospirillum amazonense TaxID=28077 RepID=A0A560J433_9PROT|nr:type VI secretion system lipoprotein TssJ [Nitrospirillum amazonense]TWB65585.1 type VI secretion system protein VasD [Nitrospirillum amazonense]